MAPHKPTDAWLRSGAGPHKTKRELTEQEDIEEQMEYDYWEQAMAASYWKLEEILGTGGQNGKSSDCKSEE